MPIEPSSSSITGDVNKRRAILSTIPLASSEFPGNSNPAESTLSSRYSEALKFSSTPYPNTSSSSTEPSPQARMSEMMFRNLQQQQSQNLLRSFGSPAPARERPVDAEAEGTIEHYATEALKPHSSRAEGREAVDNLKSAADVLSGRGNWQEAQETRLEENFDKGTKQLDEIIKSLEPPSKSK